MFTKRRKDVCEALHPETKHGSNQHSSSRQVGDSTDRFTSDTAAKTGQSERAIQRDAERGSKIAERALSLVKGSKLDSGSKSCSGVPGSPAIATSATAVRLTQLISLGSFWWSQGESNP